MDPMPAWRQDSPVEREPRAEPVTTERQDPRIRRYSRIVTLAMIILCNAVFLAGIRWSGVNLDDLIRTPELFNPTKDVCLRLKWQKVDGDSELVRLCSEWIDLSDPSGNTHSLQTKTEVVKGGNGKLYFNHGAQVDYRLFVFAAFVVGICICGFVLRWYLIRRYRMRLEAPIGHHIH